MDGTARLEPYAVLHLYLGLRLNPQWQARVRLENAFDRDYQLVYGYNTPPRGIFATLRYSPAN
jgi:vitamin B12 transporter